MHLLAKILLLLQAKMKINTECTTNKKNAIYRQNKEGIIFVPQLRCLCRLWVKHHVIHLVQK